LVGPPWHLPCSSWVVPPHDCSRPSGFIYDINEWLVAKDTRLAWALLVSGATACFAGGLVLTGVAFHFYAPRGSCSLNIFFGFVCLEQIGHLLVVVASPRSCCMHACCCKHVRPSWHSKARRNGTDTLKLA
jgi:hypothetical protein